MPKEPIKITEEELKKFFDLKNEIQQNVYNLGELYLEKLDLDDHYSMLSKKEATLRENTDSFKKQEIALMDSILEKYGEGSLNITSGEFTPVS